MRPIEKRRAHTGYFWLFVLPALLLYVLFMLAPLAGTLGYSLSNWDGISVGFEFVGLKNYVRLFTQDSAFRISLLNSFKFVGIYTVLVNLVSISLALLLDAALDKLRGVVRSIIFMPNVISLIMVAFVWKFMFTKVYDELSITKGGFLPDIAWFGSNAAAMATIIITLLWQSTGYFMVIYVAGLQSIDQTYYEAATIDGANYWHNLWHITLPMLMPSITVNLFLAISGAFKTFELPYLMTRGGPGDSTNLIAYNIYREAYLANHAGYASAKAVILCIIVMFVAVFQIRAMKKREVEV